MATDAVAAVDAGAFELIGESGPALGAAALCVHGLTGTPYDMRSIAHALAEAGFRVRAPILPGHEFGPHGLARTPREAWLACVRAELAGLRAEHDQVFVCGLSLGGLLALAVGAEGQATGLCVIATPLRFGAAVRLGVPLLKHLLPLLAKRSGSDIQDPEARAINPGMNAMPLASVHELIRLQGEVAALLPTIEVATLVAHGARDRTANPSDARWLADRLTGNAVAVRVEQILLERSGHVVPVDYDSALLAARVRDFFTSLLGRRSSPGRVP
jgi:carboxylesterase